MHDNQNNEGGGVTYLISSCLIAKDSASPFSSFLRLPKLLEIGAIVGEEVEIPLFPPAPVDAGNLGGLTGSFLFSPPVAAFFLDEATFVHSGLFLHIFRLFLLPLLLWRQALQVPQPFAVHASHLKHGCGINAALSRHSARWHTPFVCGLFFLQCVHFPSPSLEITSIVKEWV